MASVQDFLQRCYTHHGHPYSTIGRFGPWNYDCSGHVWSALNDVGLGNFAQSSSTQYVRCNKISLGQAINTPGALIFRPNNPILGIGNAGHVAVSLGNGWTSEARGRAYGVGSWPIAGRGFSARAGLIPGLSYGNGGGGAPNIGAVIKGVAYATLLAVADGPDLAQAGQGQTDSGPEVGHWQDALNLTTHAGLKVDWSYGSQTARATGKFQAFYNAIAGRAVLNEFGVVDGPTRGAQVQALENLINTI